MPRLYPVEKFLSLEKIDDRNTRFLITDQEIQSPLSDSYSNTLGSVDVSTKQFSNWMQIEGTSKFKKLWGIIEDEIPQGKYTLKIIQEAEVENKIPRKLKIVT